MTTEPRIIDATEHVERIKQLERLKAWKPKPRNIVQVLARRFIGLQDDVDKGELFERLITSNISALSSLVEGLRRDLDASNGTQNPVNVLVAELQQRLSFYEQHNDSLQPTWRKYLRQQEKLRQLAEAEAANKAREAAKHELKTHALNGEVIDCRDCGGDGWDEGNKTNSNICRRCNGSGVELNPDYIPPTENNNGSDSQEGGTSSERHLQLDKT